MRSRVFRCLVCLLVAAVMIVNLSPLYVHATSTAVTAVVVGVGIVVATAIAFQALGVRHGTDHSVFNQLVSDCSAALSADWAANGLVNMLAVNDGVVTKTFASQNFLQSVLDWLFDSGSVTATEDYVFPLGDRVLNNYDEMMAYPFHCVAYNTTNGEWFLCGSNGEFRFTYNESSGGYFISSVSEWYHHCITASGWTSYDAYYHSSGSGLGTFTRIYETGLLTEVSTSSDLILESVGTDIETDYDTYVDEGIISVDFGIQFEDDPNTGRNEDDDNNAFWLPAAIPGLNEGIYTDQTQADAQSGLTDPDIIQQLLDAMNGSGNGSGTGSDNTNSSWNPPSDHNKFALGDLSKFFPFCIPFDLFDFFTLLNADPVAPVFSWEIQDLSGQTYSLTVDLSEWDSVAQLFRRLQLFLFICGLAAASRKYIKW